MKIKFILSFIAILFTGSHFTRAEVPNKTENIMRSIQIAGVIIDSNTLLPINDAIIHDEKGNRIGKTDNNGYFTTKLDVLKKGEIWFSLKIRKEGYTPFTQNEHWGDLDGDSKVAFFISMEQENLKQKNSSPTSTLMINPDNLTLNAILSGLESFKKEIIFEQIVEDERENNENVVFQIDGDFYLVSNLAWIKLKSKFDSISIDGTKVVSADEINGTIQRNEIMSMSPIDSKEAQYIVHTEQ